MKFNSKPSISVYRAPGADVLDLASFSEIRSWFVKVDVSLERAMTFGLKFIDFAVKKTMHNDWFSPKSLIFARFALVFRPASQARASRLIPHPKVSKQNKNTNLALICKSKCFAWERYEIWVENHAAWYETNAKWLIFSKIIKFV